MTETRFRSVNVDRVQVAVVGESVEHNALQASGC